LSATGKFMSLLRFKPPVAGVETGDHLQSPHVDVS